MSARNAAGLLLALVLLPGCEKLETSLGLDGRDAQAQAPAAKVQTTAPDPLPPVSTPTEQPVAPAPGHEPSAEPSAAGSRLVPFQTNSPAASAAGPARCELPGLTLPEQFVVYAAGAYSGRELDYQIDQSGHQATRIDVALDEPSAPVFLMLGAYEPTVWNIGWSPRTRIAGVLVSGYHRQAIAGLPPAVPRLNSSYDNKGACGYFYVSQDKLDQLNPISRRLFGQPVTRAFLAKDGFVAIGSGSTAGLITDANQPPDQFRDRAAPLAGEAGLRDAVARGLLREARSSDVQDWRIAYDAANRRDTPPLSGAAPSRGEYRVHNGYVVLKAMQIPAGLYGAHSATFIVPRGVPRPTGNPGHSTLLDYNTMTCAGATCGMD